MVADLFEAKPEIGPVMQQLLLIGKKRLSRREKRKQLKKEKKRLSEFKDVGDWVLTMIMVALMHVNPDKQPEDVVEEGREWAKKIWQPNMKHIWRSQAIRIKRHGVRAEASKIRREMFKLL